MEITIGGENGTQKCLRVPKREGGYREGDVGGWACVQTSRSAGMYLEQVALVLLAAASAARQKGGTSGVLKDLTDSLVRLGRALEVLVGADLLANLLTLYAGVSDVLTMLTRQRYQVNRPPQATRASGSSCGAPQSSCCRSGDPSCSRQG